MDDLPVPAGCGNSLWCCLTSGFNESHPCNPSPRLQGQLWTGTPLACGIGQGSDGKVEGDSCGEPCSLGMWEQHFGVGEDGESLQNQVQ